MRDPAKVIGAFLIAAVLQSCSAVDQFDSRIEDANRNSQRATDQETLLNIVRAKYFRPLTFVAVSQINGGLTETLTTGLPTITFGSGITPAQHIGQISNSVMSQATGNYQSNVLLSTAFQTGMLAPIPEATIAYLIAAHPRDPVLFSTIDALLIKSEATGAIYRLGNNPDLDDSNANCIALLNEDLTGDFLARYSNVCPYSLFIRMTQFLIQKGLSVEIVAQAAKGSSQSAKKSGQQAAKTSASGAGAASATKSSPASSGSGDQGASTPQGRFCFDPTKSVRSIQQPTCSIFTGVRTKNSVVRFQITGIGMVDIEISKKSPLGVYQLLGAFLRNPPEAAIFAYRTDEGTRVKADDRPFIEVVNSPIAPCFTAVAYGGTTYCVPADSYNTAVLFDIVEQLKNLSTTPADLNVPFAVRFVGN